MKIFGLWGRKAQTTKAQYPAFESLDALARIGGFTGGAQGQLLSLQDRIASATEETARNTGNQP